MASFTLTDLSQEIWTDSFELTAAHLGIVGDHDWSVTKKTLKGGRREGVDLIQIHHRALSVAIVPTRGMGLWRGSYRGDSLGWTSPVVDGPVNPAFVHQGDRGGLGWLDGFDELMVRCGLEHNGPPYEVALPGPDGSIARHVLYPLHGRIANRPAHHVSVHVDEAPPHTITIEGRVAESTIFHAQIEMTTRIRVVPGSNRLVVRDEFVNRSDSPGSMQLLYHWNFGPPYLGEGATFTAPLETLAPRDPRSAEGLDHWTTYGAPEPGFVEQAYFAELRGEGPEGRTLAMLKGPGGTKAIVLRFKKSELPCFTLWKNTRGMSEGYVTGLEPATNFPNPRPFEEAQGRVVPLKPGESFVAETTLEILDQAGDVAAVDSEIKAIQARSPSTIHPDPTEPFTPSS